MEATTVEVKSKTIIEKRNEKPKNLPISILILFFSFLLVFGFDFGFVNVMNKKLRRLCKYYSRLICFVGIITFGIPLFNGNTEKLVFGTIYFLQLLGNVIALHTAKYKVYHYITDIRAIDIDIRSNESFGGLCAVLSCFFIWEFQLVGCLCLCFLTNFACLIPDNSPVQVLYCIFLMCLDSTPVIQILVYYYAYCAVKYLKHLVDDRKSDVIEIRKQFTFIADCCGKIQPLYGNLVSDFKVSFRIFHDIHKSKKV